MMKSTKFFLLLMIILLAASISGCSGRSLTPSGFPSINADNSRVYLAFDKQVYAVDLKTGKEVWRFPTDKDVKATFYAKPELTDDGQLIVGSYNGKLFSLDPENGSQNWVFDGSKGQFVGSALITEQGIFAPSSDSSVYALTKSGSELWKPFETSDPIWASPVTDANCDCIIVPSMDHHLYALDSQTGSLLWKTEDLGGAIVSTPAISDDDILYIGTFDKEVLAIDKNNQQIIWRFSTNDWVWASPVIDQDKLYFGDLSGTFYALDRKSGSKLWEIQPAKSITGKPLVKGDSIFFGSTDGKLISTNTEGAIRWTQEFEGHSYTEIVDADGTILVATDNTKALIRAYDESGKQVWVFTPEKKK